MAKLAKGKLRRKLPELALALEGRVEEHHRFILRIQLERLKQLDAQIDLLEERIEQKLEPYRKQHQQLRQIPGVDWALAAVIIAELGIEMSVFRSPKHGAAWAGVAPSNNESAGKKKGTPSRKGNVYLKTALVEAANAALCAKGTYYQAKFRRLKARRGHKRAAVAVAHKIFLAAYYMLRDGTDFRELGTAYLDQLQKARLQRGLVRRLEGLGFNVALTAKPSLISASVPN
jgi:transposase